MLDPREAIFFGCIKKLPKAVLKTTKDTIAYEALKRIGAIYHLDNQLADFTPDDRKNNGRGISNLWQRISLRGKKRLRQTTSFPEGKHWKGLTTALKVFLHDGEVPYDNNATEGALHSFCLHKHAWKLIDSIDGAKSSASIYSITETAKANNLNPFCYLGYLLTAIKDHQEDTDCSFIKELLIWSDQLPDICRSKSKTTNV